MSKEDTRMDEDKNVEDSSYSDEFLEWCENLTEEELREAMC